MGDLSEDLQTRLVDRFVTVLLRGQSLQLAHQDVLKGRIASAERAAEEVDPGRDQDLFIDHNIRPFAAPADWIFEPCSGHYDTVSQSPNKTLEQLSDCNTFNIGGDECGFCT